MKSKILGTKAKFVFVSGGVLSSLGKGILAASVANVLKSRGLNVSLLKMDPYLNVDSGTMSPYQHGEVFVTKDGCETDLDLGHYERFADVDMSATNSCTSGKVYANVIKKEREGHYLGKTVQVVPHITEEIQSRIIEASHGLDILIVEIGGTVGDIESLPFLEAVRQMHLFAKDSAMFIHLTYLPYLHTSGEVKTKPTQHSVKELRAIGIQPDILCCRSELEVSADILQKISLFTNVDSGSVFSVEDVDDIYKVPLLVKNKGIDQIILDKFGFDRQAANLAPVEDFLKKKSSSTKSLKIAIIAKYSILKDAYISLIESLKMAGICNGAIVSVDILDAEEMESATFDFTRLSAYDGIVISGGFGVRGVEGKIKAIHYARTSDVPMLGICLGMQLACIEYARNVLGIKNANSSEFDQDCPEKIVSRVEEWSDHHKSQKLSKRLEMGGTMRLGEQQVMLEEASIIREIYGTASIYERHRHRYEINHEYIDRLLSAGMKISGYSVDGLVEVIELPKETHRWFVATQFHPEFGSRMARVHPLFSAFLSVCLQK